MDITGTASRTYYAPDSRKESKVLQETVCRNQMRRMVLRIEG